MESNQLNSPKVLLLNRQGKNNDFQGQIKRVFVIPYRQPKGMLRVSIETGILRANIDLNVAEWEKGSRSKRVRKGNFPISKIRKGFYATRPDILSVIFKLLNTVKL